MGDCYCGFQLAKKLRDDPSARGIAICGSGIGISIALNRFFWVRAALVSDQVVARLSRQHNDANVLSLPARFLSIKEALEIVEVFLETDFEGGRHERRVDKIDK